MIQPYNLTLRFPVYNNGENKTKKLKNDTQLNEYCLFGIHTLKIYMFT